MDFVLVERDGLIDFYDLILPDVYDQLMLLDGLEENGLACIGAVENGRPVGALVFGFLEEPVVEIQSIYTAQGFRDKGIGSGMMQAVISHALQTFPFRNGGIPVLQVQLEYLLPKENMAQFENFLRMNSFKKFTELGEIYTVSGQKVLEKVLEKLLEDVPEQGQEAAGRVSAGTASAGTASVSAASAGGEYRIQTLTEIAPEAAEEMAAMLERLGLDAEVDYSCLAGDPDDPDAVMIACYGAGDVFYLYSENMKAQIPEAEYRALMRRTVTELCGKNPDCRLIVQAYGNAFPEIWSSMAEDVAEQAEAVLYAVFDEEV